MDDGEEVIFLIAGGEVKPIVTMPASATVLQLKRKITEHLKVPVARQNLLYCNIKLMDSTTIEEYNFGATAELVLAVDLHPNEMIVNITITSPVFSVGLRVNKVHKVLHLKQKVGEILGVETKDINLWHMSEKMQDDKFLYKYYLTEGSEVQFTRTGFSA